MDHQNPVTILRHDGEGYRAMMDSDGWRIAFSNDAPHARRENVTQVARHMKTEEVFVLLSGRATLYISAQEVPEKFEAIELEPYQAYVVPRATWHSMTTYEGTRLFITENAGTGRENTEYYSTAIK